MLGYDENFNKRAVALKYDGDKIAPIVIASGMGHMADRIVEVAAENEVPIFEDTSLATMLSQLDCGMPIPESLYAAVVDIYVYFLQFSLSSVEKDYINATKPEPEVVDLEQ